jgi:hypothetical protein
MKTKIITAALLSLILTTIACSDTSSPVEAKTNGNSLETENLESAIINAPTEDLSDTEKEGLLHMREEEKLARDVYLHFYYKYGIRIFSNIARAESNHMSAIKTLLDKYELEDPIIDDTRGVFQNKDLAKLYTDLTAAGDVSLLEALKIGATIEDLDIKDLMDYEKEVDNQDIILVYENLTRGSRNHLRAYMRQITRNNGTYEPQFISQELFNEIINSDRETGVTSVR